MISARSHILTETGSRLGPAPCAGEMCDFSQLLLSPGDEKLSGEAEVVPKVNTDPL